MKISIKRENKFVEYEIQSQNSTLLEVLTAIKTKMDSTLAFNSGCRSGVCGSCSMIVNEKEILACSYKVQDEDLIEPLKNVKVIRDLVVDMNKAYEFNAKAKAWLKPIIHTTRLNHEDEKINEIQSDCILCGACYSACPVYAVNDEFLGPFSLTRVWKYVSDKRENNEKNKIDTIQNNGVWDCTLCNECTLVCPQDISSKADIEKLRFKSTQHGYNNPNFFTPTQGMDGSPVF